ncbi:N-acetyltransferase family protein [uncultured Cohaesibacter sp.]|uniref:GNAT family N-acetyltransferase n=1 Tax=uncultured Cohaesibacter sp. TaxID=1002546 RepID=UPI00292F9D73|nr:N-acetyltransferase family protein [uncultured Cohaesibacter sp.]
MTQDINSAGTPIPGKIDISCRALTDADSSDIMRIYAQGIRTGNSTFADQVPSWEDWDKAHLKPCRIGAVAGGKLVGWAVLSPYSQRQVYRGIAELSLYVDQEMNGMGIGTKLMQDLVQTSEKAGIWTLEARIFPENKTSIHLHEKFGFRYVGMREKIGKMPCGPFKGQWRNVTLYERRSQLTGLD